MWVEVELCVYLDEGLTLKQMVGRGATAGWAAGILDRFQPAPLGQSATARLEAQIAAMPSQPPKQSFCRLPWDN